MAREIKVNLLGDTRSLERAFNKASNSGSTFSGGMGKVGHGLATVVKGAALAGAAVAGLGVIIGTKLVQDMASQQQMSVQTNTVIASTGQAANVTRKHIEDLATAIQNKSGLDDQAVQSGENMLLTFTNIRNEAGKGNKVFDQSVSILADMSVALGGDPQKNAIRLGKALNDPVKGISALSRVGVAFTEGQKKTIAAMVKAGDTMGAQKVILAELRKEFGGSAEAAGKTLPGQINILKGRLMDLGTSMANGVMPTLGHFVGFLNRIVSAPNMSVRLQIAWDGIKEIGTNLYGQLRDAIAGTKQVLHVHGDAIQIGHEGLAEKFQRVFDTINWSEIGHRIGAGIGKAIKIGDEALNKILDSISSWVSAHRSQLAEVGATMLAAIVIKLADPAFWAKHWDLAIGVALALGPAKFGKLGLRIGEFIVAPLSKLGGKLGTALGSAIVAAARFIGPKAEALAAVAVDLIEAGLRKGAGLVGKAALKLGQGIVEKIGAGLNKLGLIAKVLINTSLVQAILGAAVATYNQAKQLGADVIHGIVAGIQSTPGAVKDALLGVVGGAFSGAKNWLMSRSPSKRAADELGAPIGQGIILGFLAGSRDLPEKISGKLKASLESARTRIEGLRASFSTSFGRLGSDAMSAFDATTTKKLDVIARKFEKWRDKATKDLSAAMGAIDAAQGALTPSEQALQGLQGSHDQAGRDADLARGQSDLAAATTPEEQAAAQKEIDDAVYNQRIFDLGVLAAAERAAKDAEAETARAKAQAAYDEQNRKWDEQQANEQLDLQSQRDLRKRHLEDMLADLQENLAKHPKAWRKAHAKIMKIFEEEFGPDFKTAGESLGAGFRQSLIEDFEATGALLGNVGAAIRNALSLDNQAAVKPKKMATGGIVTRPTFALIGEAGPEAVIPLSRGGASGGGDVYVTVQGSVVTEQELAETIRNALIRTGRNTTRGALGGYA